jgi:signal transduction histidine kinase
VRDGGTSRLLVVSQMPLAVDMHADLDTIGPLTATWQALETLFFGGNRIIRIFGRVGESANQYEVIVPDRELRAAMLVYARNVAILSLLISLFTATLVFYAIDRIMIRPIRAMTQSMLDFGAAPDNAEHIIQPEEREDEIGIAERELAEMQKTLHRTLGERKRLADLGLAVSKINHDMRNMLASAQLISDRLAKSADPTVAYPGDTITYTRHHLIRHDKCPVQTRRRTMPTATRRSRLLGGEIPAAVLSPIEVERRLQERRELFADQREVRVGDRSCPHVHRFRDGRGRGRYVRQHRDLQTGKAGCHVADAADARRRGHRAGRKVLR